MSKKPLIILKNYTDIEEKVEAYVKEKEEAKKVVVKIAEDIEEARKTMWIYIENRLREEKLLPEDYDSDETSYTLSASDGVIFIEKEEEEKCCGGSCCSK